MKEESIYPKAQSSPSVWAFFAGTFSSEFASKALQVTLPLLLLQFSNAPSVVGFITALTAATDTSGTLLGGWLSNHLHPRMLLILATAIRSVALAFIPVLWAAKLLSLQLAVTLYVFDSLARGIADTARNTMPMILAGKDKSDLDRMNSRFQTVFELGSVVGSFLVGILLIGSGAVTANWLAPLAFGISAIIYFLIPQTAHPPAETRNLTSETHPGNTSHLIFSLPGLRLAFIGILLLTLYPLKGVLPALFADGILKAPEQTAWLVGLFGVGAVTGSVLYARFYEKIASPTWIGIGAAGVLLLAAGWVPGTFFPMALCLFLFASSNVAGRLSVASMLQSQIPQGMEGSLMGVTRFSVNLTSMVVRFLVGVAFAITISTRNAFILIGAGLAIFAVLELWVARRIGKYAREGKVQELKDDNSFATAGV